MVIVNCNVCKKSFSAKENWIKRGWGKYCSRPCSARAQMRGKSVKCFSCKKKVWRRPADLERSKSGKFFCDKRCQTLWRNSFFVGERHGNWNGGKSSYRDALKRNKRPMKCNSCGTSDERVLAVHHKDRNRGNNNLSNLEWLCHNCHYLVHNYGTNK